MTNEVVDKSWQELAREAQLEREEFRCKVIEQSAEIERLRGYWTGDKLTGGSDVCHTCHAHCVVIGDKDAEIEELKRWQLEARKLMNSPAHEPEKKL